MKACPSKKINSKQKGARFERLLASRFREYGFDARRTAQYCGNSGDAADVTGLPGVHAEAGGKGNLPAVFHKKNHAEILVTVELDTFMKLYKEWWENNATEEG